MPLLNKGRVLASDLTGDCYQVVTGRVARGGFGEIYRGELLDDHRDPVRDVAIKVTRDPLAWHGEAYFGWLLGDEHHVVSLLDAFQVTDGTGGARIVKYVLVLEWMEEGTVTDAVWLRRERWDEDHVVRQTAAILQVLARLHRRGICHGDITPSNVFVDGGHLLLGDLGIAKQALDEGPVHLAGATPEMFAPPDTPAFYWSPSDDVYQVALIALSLLAGEVMISYDATGKTLRALSASDPVKGWIRDALSKADERFLDAQEALDTLTSRPVRAARAPRSIKGQRVVFTGKLGVTRAVAQQRASAAGATVQHRVNGATNLVVAGQPNPLQIGQKYGTKLFDAHRRIRRGQRIAVIDEERFDRLLRR